MSGKEGDVRTESRGGSQWVNLEADMDQDGLVRGDSCAPGKVNMY